MEIIAFARLSDGNFNLNSMDEFLRYEKVSQAWKKVDGEYVLTETDYIKDWDLDKRRGIAKIIHCRIRSYSFAYGAFKGNKVVGYIFVSKEPFGSKRHYIELALFHISTHYRRKGISRKLFRLACVEARGYGARKLYISSSPAKDAQKAYRRFGCVHAAKINQASVDRSPAGIHLEYLL